MTPVKKTCSGCGAEQPLKRFWRKMAGRFGRYSICIDCPSGVIERHQRASRDTVLKSKYNITIDQYEELVAAQLGRCDICGSPPGKRGLAVDHNHKTKDEWGCRQCRGFPSILLAEEDFRVRRTDERHLLHGDRWMFIRPAFAVGRNTLRSPFRFNNK